MNSSSKLTWFLLLSAHAVGASPPRRSGSGNMNGRYSVASGARQDVPFNDDYASKGHEYFDVWAPEIATHYAEVFWTDQGNQPLPQHVVDRFKGKVMAITGYEMDQVMVTPTGHPGEQPEKDVSVPINWAYNHHYMAWMTGDHSRLQKVRASPEDPMAHGADSMWMAVDEPSAAARVHKSAPTAQMFSEGNGGESRKSFHGYPNGYAQLIDSPTMWHITPMQIDTRNRDCGATPADVGRCARFTAGPEPRQAHFGRGRDAPEGGFNYSGVLECPCNGRYGGDPVIYGDTKTKAIVNDYAAVTSGTCSARQRIPNAATCFKVVPTIGINATKFNNRTIADPKLPSACSVVRESDGSATVYYNAQGEAPCTSGTKQQGTSTTSPVGVSLALSLDSTDLFKRSPPGKYCSENRAGVLRQFKTPSDSKSDALKARTQCEQYCFGEERCWGCSVDCQGAPLYYGILGVGCQWSAVTACGEQLDWSGSIDGDVSQKVASGGVATITVSGPADGWFGVGLDAHLMCDLPYALIVNDQGVQEQKLGTCGDEGCHCGGTKLASSVNVTSNTVTGGVRTVVMTRPLKGLTKDHYSFDPTKEQTMHLITAVGHSQTFAYHKAHGPAEISLTSVGTATCICDVKSEGSLCDNNGQHCSQFTKNCVPEPAGDLLQQANPTCTSKTYVGGLRCCAHGRIMLDADQEIRPELLRYHIKFRFWFQEYQDNVPKTGRPSHYDLPRIYYQTEANAGEYDIPPAFVRPGETIVGYPGWPVGKPTPGTTCTGTCPDGPDCECIHTITYHWNVSNIRLLYAGGHCHAPSCVSLELYRNDTGTPKLLCRQLPKYGQGRVHEDKFDEAGYLALPPCLWGEEPGLEPSQFLPANTPLVSIKKNRNTHMGHFGEMASWQMRGVSFPAPDPVYI